MGFAILAITVGLMYVFFLLPQKKRVRAQRELLRAVDVGDEIMLTSGIYGTVIQVDEADDVIWVEVSEGMELKVARGAIAKRVGEGPPRADDALDEGDDEDDDDDVTDLTEDDDVDGEGTDDDAVGSDVTEAAKPVAQDPSDPR